MTELPVAPLKILSWRAQFETYLGGLSNGMLCSGIWHSSRSAHIAHLWEQMGFDEFSDGLQFGFRRWAFESLLGLLNKMLCFVVRNRSYSLVMFLQNLQVCVSRSKHLAEERLKTLLFANAGVHLNFV